MDLKASGLFSHPLLCTLRLGPPGCGPRDQRLPAPGQKASALQRYAGGDATGGVVETSLVPELHIVYYVTHRLCTKMIHTYIKLLIDASGC